MGTPSDENVIKTVTDRDTAEKSDSTGDRERPTEDGELHEDEVDFHKGDEEDIPDDFFDDFSNQDFMAGLDIVDAWDETEKNKKLKETAEKEEKRKQRKRSREPKLHEKRARSADRDKRKRSEEKRRRSRERRHLDDNPQKKRTTDEGDLRRDPSKTKRDLEKDRENYVKKKEQKLISKVVETGLVPPGMESEVNLSEIENSVKQQDKEKERKESLKSEGHKRSKEKGSRDRSKERRRKRSRSFDRVSPILRARSRGRSSERKRERSRGRRERSREKAWRVRSRERSFGRTRELSPFSPPFRRRRSRSISDRERWLKVRKSPSPERKYRDRMGEERMSFLEEIKMKLDGHPTNRPPAEYHFPQHTTQPNFIQPGHNVYPTQPIQVTAPPPNQYFPPNPNSPYDQNFFIGDPQPVPPINQNTLNGPPQINGPPAPVLPPTPVLPQASVRQPTPVLPPPSILQPTQHVGSPSGSIPPLMAFGGPQPIRQPVRPVPPPNNPGVTTGMDNVSKLLEQIRASTNAKINIAGNNIPVLEDKKLSLTNFLSINSRPTAFSSSAEALQKKVNVLSRCQDVLKELTGDKKFGGKLIVTKTHKYLSEAQLKNTSPLLRKEPVRFSYSTPMTQTEKSLFHNTLNKALVKGGIIPEVIVLEDEGEKTVENAPPPPVIGKQKNVPFNIATKPAEPQIVKRVLMKMCQTDPLHCEDCEKRKGIQYKSIGIQCGETERYNVGVQVIEADIINSKMPKNQSLAYLTPAQLLGRGEPTSTKVDNFSSLYGRVAPSQPYRDYTDRARGYGEADPRRADYPKPAYPGSATRDPQRFPRF